MPPQIGSPARPSRSKRESLTITRTVGKALADVMNKDKDSTVATSSTESDNIGSTPARTRAAAGAKPAPATTRDGHRTARPSLDVPRNSDRSTPKLVKRSAPTSTSKPTTRSQSSMAPPPPPAAGDSPPNKPSDKPSKPRSSLTLRGLSSALQPKPALPPSALPKYKPKPTAEPALGVPRSGARKRLSDWDTERAEEKDKSKDDAKGSEDDTDDDFVTVDRPISPLPRRTTRKTIFPVSLSLTPSTPPKRGNVLHKASSSLSSTPPRPPKSFKTSASPVTRLQSAQSSVSRPPSVASLNSQRATPVQSRKAIPTSRGKATPSRSVRRRPALADSPISSSSKLESSPANPFQLPETSGSSLLSPPLSPFLEGVSLDSIDAGDVSALLSSVVSPTKPILAPSRTPREPPPQTPSRTLHVFPPGQNSLPPQTPASSRTLSTLTTDPRQSILSLRQFLENSGDLEHLLSQPLPSIFTPDARERLLSFGFSPGVVPPPFPSAAHRPEPQTPCPVPDRNTFTSISQVLFPPVQPPEAPQHLGKVPDSKTPEFNVDGDLVELLKMQLASAESQRKDCDGRIENLERQLTLLREAREREAAELSTQVTDLEERLQELLGDREQETERRANEIETRLRDKDAEWERHVVTAIAQVQEQGSAVQERLLSVERRKGCIRSAASAWECAREIACSELELVRSNRRFVEITLAGLDVSMQQLRQ